MRIVVDIDDVSVLFLRNMQNESDEAWAEDPDDGQGGLSLQTPHMGVNARIAGVLREGAVIPLDAAE